jgi:hypothetical protein
MRNRLLSFILLLAVTVFGGAGRFLHEAGHDGHVPGETLVAGSAGESHHHHHRDGSDHQPGHGDSRDQKHDHDRCAVCQALAASGIDRLPGGMIVVAFIEPPTGTRPPVEAPLQSIDLCDPADARAPPQTTRA